MPSSSTPLRISVPSSRRVRSQFCKIDAEKCPYLTEKLNIFVMPTILLIQGGQTVHQARTRRRLSRW